MASIDEVWPQLGSETRAWLIANNGDALPDGIVAEVALHRGSATADEWFVEESEDGFALSDAAVDWVEEVANDE
jgi:hypothetical protein